MPSVMSHWSWEKRKTKPREIPLLITRKAKIKRLDDNKLGKNVEQLELSDVVGGGVKWHNHFEKMFDTL